LSAAKVAAGCELPMQPTLTHAAALKSSSFKYAGAHYVIDMDLPTGGLVSCWYVTNDVPRDS
jgi:hypothetical protein